MQEEIHNVDLAIIGAGIAGLSLAFESVRRGLRTVILDDGRRGTTHAATGLVAPRPDYMLHDIDLVRISDQECLNWAELFPEIISPRKFLVPISPNHRWRFNRMEALLKRYDQITLSKRSANIPPSSRISKAELEASEPNLRKNYFNGALSLWELTVDPVKLLKKLNAHNQSSPSYTRFCIDAESLRFELAGTAIYKIKATTPSGRNILVQSNKFPMVVVNAAGPWIKEVAGQFGIVLDIEFRLGIQIAVPGHFFQFGIITFDRNGAYCICLPCDEYVQIGPTNTSFEDHPDKIDNHDEGISEIFEIFKSLLSPDRSPVSKWRLKSGLRIKPPYGDTNRPIIWPHFLQGIDNLYTLFPGKMALGLLAARELLQVAGGGFPEVSLDGNNVRRNKLFLKAQRIASLAQVGPYLFV